MSSQERPTREKWVYLTSQYYQSFVSQKYPCLTYSCMTTDLCNMYDDIKFDLLDSLSTIEFYRNRKVSPAGPIRRQDIKIGDCHLAFSHLLKYRARAEPGV